MKTDALESAIVVGKSTPIDGLLALVRQPKIGPPIVKAASWIDMICCNFCAADMHNESLHAHRFTSFTSWLVAIGSERPTHAGSFMCDPIPHLQPECIISVYKGVEAASQWDVRDAGADDELSGTKWSFIMAFRHGFSPARFTAQALRKRARTMLDYIAGGVYADA